MITARTRPTVKILHNARAWLLAALAATFLSLAPGNARADIELVFGAYTADKATEVVRKFRPFLSYLETVLTEELGEAVTIKMQISNKYDAAIDDLVTGAVDFSRFGPASYVTAKGRDAGIEIIAMETKKGKKTFKGVIVVSESSEISEISQLRGHSFAFGDRLSTIGRYLAQKMLLDSGIHADDLSDYDYLGRHDRVGSAVGKGDYDAGALKSSTFKKLRDKGVPIRVLASFDNVTKPWIASSSIEPRVLAALRKVFLATHDPEILKTVSKSGFLPGQDIEYSPIRDAISYSARFDG